MTERPFTLRPQAGAQINRICARDPPRCRGIYLRQIGGSRSPGGRGQ